MTTNNSTRTIAALRAHLTRATAREDADAAKAFTSRIKAVEAGKADPGAKPKVDNPRGSLAALRARRRIAINANNPYATRKLNQKIQALIAVNPEIDKPLARKGRTVDPRSKEARAKAQDILARITAPKMKAAA